MYSHETIIRTLLTSPIAFHAIFAKLTDSVATGVFLSQIYYWNDRTSHKDNWFYKTFEDWHKETCLTRREWEKARRTLKGMGIIEYERRGIDPKYWYKLNLDVLIEKILNFCLETEDNATSDVALDDISPKFLPITDLVEDQPIPPETTQTQPESDLQLEMNEQRHILLSHLKDCDLLENSTSDVTLLSASLYSLQGKNDRLTGDKLAVDHYIHRLHTENTQMTTATSQQPIVCESGGKKPELLEQDLGGQIIDSREQEIEGSKTTLISKSDNLQLDRLTSDYYPVIKNIAPPVANFSQQAARSPETPVSKVDWGHFEGVMQSEVPRFNLQGSHKRLYGKLIERLYELDKGKIKNFLIWRLNALKNASTYKDVSINLITVLNSLNNEFKLDPEKMEGRIVEWETSLLGTTAVKLPDDDDLANLSIREKIKLGIYDYGRK